MLILSLATPYLVGLTDELVDVDGEAELLDGVAQLVCGDHAGAVRLRVAQYTTSHRPADA